MAKYDGLDGYCNISEKYINLYSQAVDFFQKNDLTAIARERGWTNGEMFEALISPLKGLRGDFQRCFSFAIPLEKAKTKNGNFASPAAFTYVVTMGIKTRDENTCELTTIGKYIIDKRLSVQSYSLLILSKVGVYDRNNQDDRLSNLLTIFCRYAITHPNEKYNPQVLEQLVGTIGIIDARFDITFNALVISGLLSITKEGEYCVLNQDLPIVKEIADNGDKISGPNDNAQSFMGAYDKSILEIINPSNAEIFSYKYADLVNIKGLRTFTPPINTQFTLSNNPYRPYITAIKSKPFLLLAGISGTGKSRIVRELARACWDEGSKEFNKQKPKNFEMIQVKPNWHDSTELFGYVSRISGKPEFVVGDFLKFIAKAWENKDVPYFLCLDEMNLAPVEQYFAEYLSVIESRKCNEDGIITTDAIFKKVEEEWYFNLTAQLTSDETIRRQFNEIGITLPQNLIVVGTVNMDETTFSFSRKVLDRAMTIEMNEVDLKGGLESHYEAIGKLGYDELIGTCVEGVDVYKVYPEVCDKVIAYLQMLNDELEGTPFKVAYRTRNEFLLYVVNNLPYNKDQDGNDIPQDKVIQRALDEITSMKILSRIEGDETKVSKNFLTSLEDVIKNSLKEIEIAYSVSLKKLDEMKKRLDSGYTSFWS